MNVAKIKYFLNEYNKIPIIMTGVRIIKIRSELNLQFRSGINLCKNNAKGIEIPARVRIKNSLNKNG